MKQKPRNPWWLLTAVIGLSILGWFINSYTPAPWYRIGIFFLILGTTCYSFFIFLFNNVRRALLMSSCITIFFVLRAIQLREILYPILLIACIISMEMLFTKKN